jgi:peptidoglycan/LPS O-acetylase OafA/YrhL
MNITQSINRTVNLLGVAIAGLAGFAFAPEAIIEPDWIDKVDDTLILLIGIGAIVWYLQNANRYARSIIPILFVGAALLLKIFAIAVEIADPEDVGDDFGGLILFALATALLIYEYVKAGRTAEAA